MTQAQGFLLGVSEIAAGLSPTNRASYGTREIRESEPAASSAGKETAIVLAI